MGVAAAGIPPRVCVSHTGRRRYLGGVGGAAGKKPRFSWWRLLSPSSHPYTSAALYTGHCKIPNPPCAHTHTYHKNQIFKGKKLQPRIQFFLIKCSKNKKGLINFS